MLILPALTNTHDLCLFFIWTNIVPQRTTALRFMVLISGHILALPLHNRLLDLFLHLALLCSLDTSTFRDYSRVFG